MTDIPVRSVRIDVAVENKVVCRAVRLLQTTSSRMAMWILIQLQELFSGS